MPRKKRAYRWYIEPLSDAVNEAISRVIGEESFQEGLRDARGIPRRLWECPSSFIDSFLASAPAKEKRYRIYVREGNGAMRIMRLRRNGKWRRRISLAHPRDAA